MTNSEDRRIINAALEAQRKRRAGRTVAVTTVAPTNGVLPVMNLKSLDNWRAFFHQLVMVIVPVMVTLDIATETQVTAWIPFVFAIADNILSVGNTVDKMRRTIYTVVGVLQTGGLVTVLLGNWHPEYVPIASAVLALGSAFMARFYNPTTTLVPAMRTGPEMKDVV